MITEQIQQWLTEFIVGHNICPFARGPLSLNRVKLQVLKSKREEDLTQTLLQALEELVMTPRTIWETTIIAVPAQFPDFDDFWSYCEWTQDLLIESRTEGLLQIVGFHPEFRFVHSNSDDAANYVNRSPYPLLHLLREESIEEATQQYPNIDSIPQRNALYLRRLSRNTLEQLVYGNHDGRG